MSDWREAIDSHIDAIAEDLRAVRRHLHVHPEPSREEFETTRFLAERLEEAGIPYRVIPSGRGIIAGSGRQDGALGVAIRADIDAPTDPRPQGRSAIGRRRDGVMHACGHDAHATMALGAALALWRCARELPVARRLAGDLPAGRGGRRGGGRDDRGGGRGAGRGDRRPARRPRPGGRPRRPAPGVLTAFCQEFEVQVERRGGPRGPAAPRRIDPIAAAAQFVTTRLPVRLPRSFDSREPVVVSFGAIQGGSNSNVIPDRVVLRGTIRTLGRGVGRHGPRTAVADRRGRSASRSARRSPSRSGTRPTRSSTTRVSDACAGRRRRGRRPGQVEDIPLPSMGGEDFSGYLEHVARLPAPAGGGQCRPVALLHSPFFDIDERALAIGAKILARCAVLLAR